MVSSLEGSVTSTPDVECWRSESMLELKQLLRCSSMELENAKKAARFQQEKHNAQLRQLEELLKAAEKERDEARFKTNHHRHHQPQQQHSTTSSDISWEFPDADCSFLLEPSPPPVEFSSPELILGPGEQPPPLPHYHQDHHQQHHVNRVEIPLQSSVFENVEASLVKRLPQRGQFLEAVIQAGPLLNTLMLAGPLPQWHHPPPVLHSFHIPHLSHRSL